MQFEKYTEYAVEQAKKLLAIDSPSGYGYYVTEYLLKEFACLGSGPPDHKRRSDC